MRVLFLTLLSAAACLAALPHPLSDEFIAHLNSVQSSWKAGRNFAPTTSMKAIRSMMGVLRSDDRPRLPVKEPFNTKLELPTNFDAREQWTQCASIGHIRDQSTCGSCWAFGAVEAMTDRICIATNGKTKVSVSSENLLTCCDTCGDGCDGGYPEAAWQYWVDNGIVTGGDYGTNDGCQAYYFPSCEHHVPGPKPACGESKPTPPCKNTCDSRSTSYSDSLTFGKSSYQILGEDEARQEIYTNGPVEGSFDVYADFLNYKTGVYEHTDGDYLGGHAIKILGWGEENGTPYWLVANSWNPDWGDKGFFKIKRGSNECGIEDGIVGGMPKV